MAEITAPQTSTAPVNANQQSQAPAQAPPEAPRMMKLKLDGKDVEMSESEVMSLAQQGKVAGQRFNEAAKMKQEAESILKFAKANPTEFFNKTGMNARQWAEEYLLGELQREAMSPEQKKAFENEERLRKYEATEKSQKEQALKDQEERLTKEQRERYDKIFVQALTESGLPKTQYTVKRMAELQLLNIKNSYELTPSQLASMIKEDYAAEQKSLVGALDGEDLINFFGEDIVKKLSKAQIAKLKAKGLGAGVQAQNVPQRKSGEKELTWEEYQRQNRRKPQRQSCLNYFSLVRQQNFQGKSDCENDSSLEYPSNFDDHRNESNSLI